MAPREFFEALPSTQDRAIELARAGAPDRTVVVARRQTEGKGRRGRRWVSPGGGLYLSVVLGAPPRAHGLLSLAVGAFLAAAIEERYGSRVAVKWPNDLVVAGDGPTRKLGGILVDRLARPDGGPTDVVGVGLNANVPAGGWPAELRPTPVALQELARTAIDLSELELSVLAAIRAAHSTLDRPVGAAEVVARVRARLLGLGRRVQLDGRPVGRLAGVAEDGAVRIEADDGPVEARAGELSLLEEEA